MDKPKFRVGQTVFCDTRGFSQECFGQDYLIKAYERGWKHAKIVRIFHIKCQEVMPEGTFKDEFDLPEDLECSQDEYRYELDTTIEWADDTDYGDSSRLFKEYDLMSLDELKDTAEALKRKFKLEAEIAIIDSRLTFLERQIFNLTETKKLCPNIAVDIDEKVASMNIEVAALRENRAKLVA